VTGRILVTVGRHGLMALGLFALGCGEDCETLGDQGDLCGRSEATVAIDPRYGGPVIQARLDGATRPVLIDTGSEGTIVSSVLLGVPDRTMQKLAELCLGELCFRDASVYARETPFSSADAGRPAGIIGMRWLRYFILELDRGQSVTLRRKAGPCAGEAEDLSFTEYGIPTARVTIDDQSFPETVVDSGAVFTVLGQSTAEGLGAYLLQKAEPAGACTVDGCTDGGAFVSAINTYCLGIHCQRDVPVKFPVWDAVGSSYLFMYRVDFDFAAGRLVFCAG
jgi:hypothetical protein